MTGEGEEMKRQVLAVRSNNSKKDERKIYTRKKKKKKRGDGERKTTVKV